MVADLGRAATGLFQMCRCSIHLKHVAFLGPVYRFLVRGPNGVRCSTYADEHMLPLIGHASLMPSVRFCVLASMKLLDHVSDGRHGNSRLLASDTPSAVVPETYSENSMGNILITCVE